MSKDIEMEIVRLVQEIAKDEKKVEDKLFWELPEEAKQYTDRINRKLEVLRILKDKA